MTAITLPTNYKKLAIYEVKQVRNEYIKLQNGLCYYCKKPLTDIVNYNTTGKKITIKLFPKNFFKYPIHLHHDHNTDMTIGAVHNYCNAILWEYHGE